MNNELPLLVKEKIDDYYYVKRENESLDELQEQYMDMCQRMRDNHVFIAKCNGYDSIEGRIRYCNKFTLSGDVEIMNGLVYICDYCSKARKCYCDQHAKGNLFEMNDDFRGIICKECISEVKKEYDLENIPYTIKDWEITNNYFDTK